MKIAVASDDGLNLAHHFGRTKGFLLFDVDEKKILNKNYVKNTFTGHARGHHHDSHEHHHHHTHGNILQALKECQVVISHGMGRRLLVDFENAGKDVYITSASSADVAVKQYLDGVLVHNPDKSCQHD